MAHEIDMSNKRANMAYAGALPWHGLGHKIKADASIDEWRKAAGLDWSIKKSDVFMQYENGSMKNVTTSLNRAVLYRDDTGVPLSIMSDDSFHIVQPDEILAFIGDAVKSMGWKMDTAGSLRGGRKIWALANIGEQFTLPGGDTVKGFLLAATAFDGSMASEFRFTGVQVVCANTLFAAVRDSNSQQPRVRVYHVNKLDIEAVKRQLGMSAEVWTEFVENAKRLASIKVSSKTAIGVLRKVFPVPPAAVEKLVEGQRLTNDEYIAATEGARKVLELYQGGGIGSHLTSQKGTAWGLVSATTEYFDHSRRAHSVDNRLNAAWFGSGATKKQEMVEACLEL